MNDFEPVKLHWRQVYLLLPSKWLALRTTQAERCLLLFVQTGFREHPISYRMGTGGKAAGA
jgi:hypothetical protein